MIGIQRIGNASRNQSCVRWAVAAAMIVLTTCGGSRAAVPSGVTWENHVNNNVLTKVEIFGDSVWFASAAGGVVELNLTTGEFFSYTQSVHCIPSNQISDLSIGPTGDVWVATSRGAALRPAGSGPNDSWIAFDRDNSPLNENEVLSIAADPAGGAWLGTFNDGAFFFDGVNWTQFTTLNSPMSDFTVLSIVIDDSGAKWFGHFDNSVDRLDGSVWTNFIPANTGTPPLLCGPVNPPDQLGLISGFVRVLGQDPFSGSIWFDNQDDGGCALNGTTVFDGTNWKTYTPLNSDILFRTEDIAADSSGFTWLVSLNGIQQFDGSVFTEIASNGAPTSARGVAVDPNGSTWFATQAGIFELNTSGFTQHPPLGLNENSINDLAFRTVGNNVEAWVAHQSGVQKYNGISWSLLTPDNSPLSSFLNSAIAVDLNNDIWIGSSVGGAGVHRTNESLWTTFTTANSGLISTAISDIAVDPVTGDVWFGDRFSAGLSVFRGSSWETFLPDGAPFSCATTNGVPGRNVTDIEIDDAGIVWVASGCGLSRFDGEIWETLTTADGLAHNSVRDIDIADDGTIWVGTFRGVSRYSNGSFASWLTTRDVRTVTTTPNGAWISMFNIGVAFYDGVDWIQFGTDDGLVNNRVFDSTETHPVTGDPWFGTEGGIAIVADMGLPADIDQDGDVDESDFDSVASCLAGPRVFLPPTGCSQTQFEAADIHGDGDVDLGDLASLMLQVQSP